MRIGTSQSHAIQNVQCGIIRDTQEIGKHALIYFFRERLPFSFAALAMPFEAMPQNLMEKYGCCAPLKQSGPVKWLCQLRDSQSLQVGSHFFFFRGEFLFAPETLGLRGLKSLYTHQEPFIGGS